MRAMRIIEKDPRLAGVKLMLQSVKHVVPVMSSKGGVGKTLISVLLSLHAARMGLRVGLLDLDITNPTAHIALGVEPSLNMISEEKGIIPPAVHGVKFMTIAFFTGENPIPLRGDKIDSTIKEILAVTRWGKLDILFVDTPPGTSDETLDVLSYMEKPKPVVVATPSPMTIKSVARMLKLLREEKVEKRFLIENMSSTTKLKNLAEENEFTYLGSIPPDPKIDETIGNPQETLNTRPGKAARSILEKLLQHLDTQPFPVPDHQ